MKKTILITLFLLNQFVLAQDTASIEEYEEYGISLSMSYKHACAIDEAGVKCWGENRYGQSNVPTLASPEQVAVGAFHSCALDDNGVKCWGQNDHGQTIVPLLSNPRQITAGSSHSCALDDNGVKCWGGVGGESNVPLLHNPRRIITGTFHSCALDDTGVKCWGRSEIQIKVPKLVNPRLFAADNGITCAVDDEGVKCWGSHSHRIYKKHPILTDPYKLTVEGTRVCALDVNGLKCWGPNYYDNKEVVSDSEPMNYFEGQNYCCLVKSGNVNCWKMQKDDFDTSIIPIEITKLQPKAGVPVANFRLYNLEIGLKKFSQVLYTSKSNFILGLSNLVEGNHFSNVPSGSNLSRFLLLDLISPIVELTPTEFVQKKILPPYLRAVSEGAKSLGVSSVEEIGLFAETISVSIGATSLALQSMKMNVLLPGTKKNVEEFLAQVGSLKAEFQNGYNNSQATKLLNLIQQNKSLIEELTQNKDTEAFALVLLKIESFLSGK